MSERTDSLSDVLWMIREQNKMNKQQKEILEWAEKMGDYLKVMRPFERAELERWEKENIDGCTVGTHDWPGWEKRIGKYPVSKED